MTPTQSLKSRLVEKKPREIDGTRSSNRTDFQKDWALCHLLDLFEDTNRKNYLVVLDYHDDVVVLDSEVEPVEAEFYQVKTSRDDRWTVARLFGGSKEASEGNDEKGTFPGGPTPSSGSKAARTPPPAQLSPSSSALAIKPDVEPKSILGKLCANQAYFPRHTKGLYLVSNAPFNLALANGSPGTESKVIRLSELAPGEADKILRRLRDELQIPADSEYRPPLFFVQTPMGAVEHDTFATGVLAKFLEGKSKDPRAPHPVRAVYRALFDEIKRKTDYEWNLSNFSEIAQHKGISRKQLARLIEDADPYWTRKSLWQRTTQFLSEAGTTARQLREIRQNWNMYDTDCMNDADDVFRTLRQEIISAANHVVLNNSEWKTLIDATSVAYTELRRKCTHIPEKYERESYLKAAILTEVMYVYERDEERELQAPDPKPAEAST